MTDFWIAVASSLTTLAAVFLGYWLTGKPRLFASSPDSTTFNLQPSSGGGQPIHIRAGQIIIQNSGRISANNLQITAELGPPPWGYNIVPNMAHSISNGARGEWIMEVPFLGPNETVTVQILNGPQIASVRASEGPAKHIPIIHQRIYPKSFTRFLLFLMSVGAITTVYALCVFGIYLFSSAR